MFTTYRFIGFMLICFVLYYSVPKTSQWKLLLAASYVFYFMAGMFYPLFLIATTVTIYLCALRIDNIYKAGSEKLSEIPSGEKKEYRALIKRKARSYVILAVLFNLAILAVLKYANFGIENLNAVLGLVGSKTRAARVDFIMPLGISFYTFQAIGYLLDVYWKKVDAQRSFFRFSLFTSFFPQLSQGPISRYGDLQKTLYEEHHLKAVNIWSGLERILWGYFKKLVIADRIAPAVHTLTGSVTQYDGIFVVVEMLFYAVMLYADFTGGIDITIGIAQVFGIKLEENFVRPFFSKGIKEYWRRWHISMGTWFRDYVFYPLSISRPLKKMTTLCKKHFGMKVAKRAAVYTATIILWLATGIWHGSQWNFVMWGLMNGVIIIISQELEPLYDRFHKKFPRLTASGAYRCFMVVRTFFLMSSLRLFDNATVGNAFSSFFSIFTDMGIERLSAGALLSLGIGAVDYIILCVGVLLMLLVSLLQRTGSVRERINQRAYPVRYAVVLTLFFAVVLLGAYGMGYEQTSFIYNRF